MPKQVILVTGSRDYKRTGMIDGILTGLLSKFFFGEFTLVQGGAPGADKIARDWAIPMLEHIEPTLVGNVKTWTGGVLTMHEVKAEWDRYGKAAGMKRNSQMLEFGPKICVAFKDDFDHTLSHGGTENMCEQAIKSGIPTYLIQKLELPK